MRHAMRGGKRAFQDRVGKFCRFWNAATICRESRVMLCHGGLVWWGWLRQDPPLLKAKGARRWGIDLLPAFIRENYECHEWKHAAAILTSDFPMVAKDIIEV